jgi:uncharacterized protein YutE (UPF0331/DUF86 family)
MPGSTNEMLYLLEENRYLDSDLTEKMVMAVGFIYLIVYEYDKIDMLQVFKVAREDVHDLHRYIQAVVKKIST